MSSSPSSTLNFWEAGRGSAGCPGDSAGGQVASPSSLIPGRIIIKKKNNNPPETTSLLRVAIQGHLPFQPFHEGEAGLDHSLPVAKEGGLPWACHSPPGVCRQQVATHSCTRLQLCCWIKSRQVFLSCSCLGMPKRSALCGRPSSPALGKSILTGKKRGGQTCPELHASEVFTVGAVSGLNSLKRNHGAYRICMFH